MSCQIKIYDTSDMLVHTVTDAVSCTIELSLTSNPGAFSFTLLGQKGLSYIYNDIGANYRVKIYLGYGTLTENDLQLYGKILKITNSVSDGKCLRTFEGKDLGEQLERTFKTNQRYQDVDAADIVTDLATELDILDAAKIDADTTEETITVRTENYWSILQKVSDYWFDGSTKVQKDFHVDTEGELVWKARPFRTEGVTPLVFGAANSNIISYKLIYDILPTKNKITVIGAATSTYPIDKDLTESDAEEWTVATGSVNNELGFPPTASKVGDNSTHLVTVGSVPHAFEGYRLHDRLTIRDINTVCFWSYFGSIGDTHKIRLLAPDTSNYFTADITEHYLSWAFESITLGESNEYDADTNPTGKWTKQGSPNWWDICGVGFELELNNEAAVAIDGLHYKPARPYYTASDATSQTNYGIREAEYTDENLLTYEECQKRAESLLMQQKEKTIALDAALIRGNTNIKRGDRISVTLAPDNITALDFDCLKVIHTYNIEGLNTSAQLLYSADIRLFPPQNPQEALTRSVQQLKNVTTEAYSRVVR